MSASSLGSRHSTDNTDSALLPSIRQSVPSQIVSSSPSLLVESTRIQPIQRNKVNMEDSLALHTPLSLRSQSSNSLSLRPSSAKSIRSKLSLCNSPNVSQSLIPNMKQFLEMQERLKAEKHRSELREMTIVSLKQQLSLSLKENQDSRITTGSLEQFKNAFSKIESLFDFDSDPPLPSVDHCLVIARVEQLATEGVNLRGELDAMNSYMAQLQSELSQEKDIAAGLREEIELKESNVLERSSYETSSNPASLVDNVIPFEQQQQQQQQQQQNNTILSVPFQETFSSPQDSSCLVVDTEMPQRILDCINRLLSVPSTMDASFPIHELLSELDNVTIQVECNRSQLVLGQERYERLSVENRANRETISRLAAQIQRIEEEKSLHDQVVANLKDYARQAEIQAKCYEADSISLKHQIEQIVDTKTALMQQSTKLQDSLEMAKRNAAQLSNDKAELNAKLAAYEDALRPLTQSLDHGSSISSHILNCIAGLDAKTTEIIQANALISELKPQITALEDEVDVVRNQYNEAETRNNKLEHELSFFESQGELIERKELQFSEFCHQLGNAMLLDQGLNYVIEGGIAYDALLARAEQLARGETEKLTEKSQAIVSLRNKLKLTQQQLHNKELQLDVVQRRFHALDEKNRDLQANEDAYKKATDEHQKIQKDCSHLRKQALSNRNIIQKLKEELEHTSDIRRDNKSMSTEISHMEQLIQQLTMDKKRLHQQLAKAVKEAAQTPPKQEVLKIEDNKAKITELQLEVDNLRSDGLKTLSALDQAKAREAELIEVVCSVANLLELPIKTKKKGSKETFIIPTQDDIRSALTDLIESSRMQQDATRALRDSLLDMEKTFRKNVCHTLAYIHEEETNSYPPAAPEL